MADPFTLQAHITDACNLRCGHCYRDERRGELPLSTWRAILDDFTAFCRNRRIEGRVTFAGGEPLLRLTDLLALTREANQAQHQVHLLTNGIGLTTDQACALKNAGCLRVQVSIDGAEIAHDTQRGKGTYAAALEGLRNARNAGLHTTISMTVDQHNVRDVPEVARLAQQENAKLFISRLVPCGRGAAHFDSLLSPSDWLKVMRLCRKQRRVLGGNIAFRDPLYAPLDGSYSETPEGVVDGCACGYGGLAVESDGTAFPCRRLPVPLGNVATEGLEKIWCSPVLEALRNRDQLHEPCGTCRHRWLCGGCRAIAWAKTNDLLAPDPQCSFSTPRLRSLSYSFASRNARSLVTTCRAVSSAVISCVK
jgi:radical SAM protein with 4Fe4S-binding SPASM domain